MITLNFCETTYPPLDDDEYFDEGETDFRFGEYTFGELVRLMREYNQPSCSPPSGAVYEWLNAEPETDYRTGEHIERSMHYSRDNPPRMEKYWRKAMIFAGVIK